jgi:flagellar hook-associated protein 1 FlgK
MLGLYGTLNLAAQSMDAQMAGVEVTGQNLANVNTTGYARQTVDIETSPDISTNVGPEGTGAEVASIQQISDSLLDSQIQSQQSVSGYWNSQQTALQSAQTNLDEYLNGTASSSSSSTDTTSTGLSAQLSGLFSDFSSLATTPTSVTAQQAVVNQAQNLATTFNQVSSQLDQLNTSLNSSVTSDVSSANGLLTNIASLNSEITSAESSGGTANDLLDTREQDLENLSQLVNITTSTGTGSAVNISIDGQTLVSGGQTLDQLQTYDSGNGNLLVQTATGGVPLTLTGGSIQGTIDARDGTLATLQSNLNTLASTLITQVNGVEASGYSPTGTTGTALFTGTGASDIAVNSSLVNNPALLQSSDSASSSSDNSVALQLADLSSATQSDLNDQTFSDSYDSTVASLGDALQTANDQVTNQTAVTTMLQTQQSDVSGVNVDQEMTNLMGFQRAYEASAQLVTTINTMMGDTLTMKTS